jgi:hypothetical protein
MYLSIYYAGSQAVIFLIKLSSKFSQRQEGGEYEFIVSGTCLTDLLLNNYR